MAELWTFSGINSPADGLGGFVDYAGKALLQRFQPPGGIARRFASQLGTGRRYPLERSVARLLDSRVLPMTKIAPQPSSEPSQTGHKPTTTP